MAGVENLLIPLWRPCLMPRWRAVIDSDRKRGGNVRIKLNGEPRELPDGTTVTELLAQLKLDSRFLAVERNRQLVPRTEHAACRLQEGDEVEVVTLVGGG
jgi:sulfur carrier protein